MAMPEPNASLRPTQTEERGAGLVLLPIAATLTFYLLPQPLQQQTIVQFVPQILSYLALALWGQCNTLIITRLGLATDGLSTALRFGIVTGLLLGGFNTFVILDIVPHLGGDIRFLTTTPHARMPIFIMLPWFICAIAFFVELNFRGFLMGRLLAYGLKISQGRRGRLVPGAAIGISATVFAFDPFMVATFKHLHWIAIWDGIIWGVIWLRTRNLYATIAAHAIEVMVVYSAVRAALD
jgi:hypothetical protein